MQTERVDKIVREQMCDGYFELNVPTNPCSRIQIKQLLIYQQLPAHPKKPIRINRNKP
jgi:hypothetical protein